MEAHLRSASYPDGRRLRRTESRKAFQNRAAWSIKVAGIETRPAPEGHYFESLPRTNSSMAITKASS